MSVSAESGVNAGVPENVTVTCTTPEYEVNTAAEPEPESVTDTGEPTGSWVWG